MPKEKVNIYIYIYFIFTLILKISLLFFFFFSFSFLFSLLLPRAIVTPTHLPLLSVRRSQPQPAADPFLPFSSSVCSPAAKQDRAAASPDLRRRCSSATAQPSQPVLSPSKPRPPREPVTAVSLRAVVQICNAGSPPVAPSQLFCRRLSFRYEPCSIQQLCIVKSSSIAQLLVFQSRVRRPSLL